MKLEEFLGYLEKEPLWVGAGTVGVMSRASDGETPLHAALWAGDDEAARALIDAGADVNAKGDLAYTPLHVAIAQENVEMARYLTDHGASWEPKTEIGGSPLEEARRSESVAIHALADELAK